MSLPIHRQVGPLREVLPQQTVGVFIGTSSRTLDDPAEAERIYFEDQPGQRAAANLLTADKAQRLAANFAKPDSLQQTILIAVEERYPNVKRRC